MGGSVLPLGVPGQGHHTSHPWEGPSLLRVCQGRAANRWRERDSSPSLWEN